MKNKFRQTQTWLIKKILWLFKEYSIPQWLVFLHDNLAVFVTFILAYILRFNLDIHGFNQETAFQHALTVTLAYVLFSLVLRSYSGMLRHTTIIDIFYVLLATTLSFGLLILLTNFIRISGILKFHRIPLSILTIHYMVITVYLFGVRIVIKTVYHMITSNFSHKKNVLIFGAGELGVIVKRVIQSDVKGDYNIAGFLDNNKNLQGKKLNGIPVYSPKSINKKLLEKHRINIMILAIQNISLSEKSEIIRTALDLGLEVRDTPAVDTWLNGELHLRQIEKVKLEDLLGRDPIELNIKRIGIGLRGKTILVTGAAGSIGSEIVRQLTRFPMKNLILVDQAETPMFNLGNELMLRCSQCSVHMILADVTLPEKMDQIFADFRPEIVFHAAAYKHVPVMEENPHEAMRVNVGGTKIITKLAVKYGVKKFVMISTDKAVNPTNIMGASKRLCEMIVQQKSKKPGNRTQFIITRFGNVLGSNGSVIPIFKNQIENGGPVTVTHPEITRYFMTIPEACQLVLEAGFMGHGGEIFVFDMGNPIKIIDLANQMIRLSGFVPDKDIKISYTGLRPGEKLYEELLANEEYTKPTHHPKIKIAKVKEYDNSELLEIIETVLEKIYQHSNHEIAEICRLLVPEYKSNNHDLLADQKITQLPDNYDAVDKNVEEIVRRSYQALRNFIGFRFPK